MQYAKGQRTGKAAKMNMKMKMMKMAGRQCGPRHYLDKL